MCEHENQKYIPELLCDQHEIYMCQDCGVLLDAYSDDCDRPVTPKELVDVIHTLLDEKRDVVIQAVESVFMS